MKTFFAKDLESMSRFYRANLINCLTGIKPALLIGTVSGSGVSNAALFSSVFHLGADPPLIGHVQRPLTGLSHTYRNILETGYYTLNHIPVSLAAVAHHTSAKFGNDQSEFDTCGLGEEFLPGFPAPFVRESAIRTGMRFIREIHLPENDTRLIIGRVEQLSVQEGCLYEDGNIELGKGISLSAGGLETYYSAEKIARFAYAKADSRPIPVTEN